MFKYRRGLKVELRIASRDTHGFSDGLVRHVWEKYLKSSTFPVQVIMRVRHGLRGRADIAGRYRSPVVLSSFLMKGVFLLV